MSDQRYFSGVAGHRAALLGRSSCFWASVVSKAARFAPFMTFGLFAILVNEQVELSPLAASRL